MSTQQRFDGQPVSIYEGRFNGGFEIDPDAANQLGLDGLAVFVVAARVGRAQFETLKSGDLRRRNIFVVTDARALTGAIREQAIEYLAQCNDLDFAGLAPPEEAPPVDENPADFIPAPIPESAATSGHRGPEDGDEKPYQPPDGSIDEVVQVGAIKPRDEVLRNYLEASTP
jgi:hypothetical protein